MLSQRLILLLISLALLSVSPFAAGRALSAPSPSTAFSMSFHGTLGQQFDLPGNRDALELAGKLELPSGFEVNTGPSTIYFGDPDCPPSIQAPVTTVPLCWPARITVQAEVSEGVALALQCPVHASADGAEFEIAGRCVVVVGDHQVSARGSLTGSVVLEPGGALDFALDGKAFCQSLDPKDCPFV
jgi:hypothetical protein